jgi:hypothetical protein
MSELGGVIILTNFQGFSTGSRKAVDNPAPLGACELRQICLLQKVEIMNILWRGNKPRTKTHALTAAQQI